MTGHRMIGMAKECFAIFGGNARRSQSTRERVAKVMDANQRQSCVASGVLPTAVVHRVDTPAAKREDPDRMKRSLCFYNRPGDIIQNHNMGSLGLEGLRRNHEHASF
jgi:hypothetical protein